MKRAQELDPFSTIINAELGLPYFYARRYDEAIAQFKKAIEMDPNFAFSHFVLARVYEQRQNYEAAIAERRKATELIGGDIPQTWIALAGQTETYRTLGEKGFWQKRLEATIKSYEQHETTAEQVAGTYAILGDKEQAFAWLERAYHEHRDLIIWLNTDPILEPLRSDLRFHDLARRVGLPAKNSSRR